MAGTMNRPLLLEQLQRHEGLRLKPYLDTAEPPRQTIGYGRNLDDRGITEEEAGFMLDNDIDEVIADLERMPLYLSLDDTRQVVLANMCFNLGLTRFLEFRRMLAALADRDWDRAADEMLDSKWARQVGDRADELADLMRRGEAR
ncbi:glycoside hydrolase family protein [Marinobacter xestospongiae]